MAGGSADITVPPIAREAAEITIEGLSPLLSHRFADRQKEAMRDAQGHKARGARPPKDPQADFQDSIYRTADGHPAFPASAIKKACTDACSFIDGITKVQARGAFFIVGDMLPIEGDPTLHESTVRLNGRTADLRYRALYPRWSITFQVLYNPHVIALEGIVNMLENAGFSIGIGDWRPQKDGSFGMFRVKRSEEEG